MLNTIRRGSKSFLAKILIGLLVIGFALFGVSEFVNQINPTEVARAGNTPVPANEFARIYERARTRTSQQIGRSLTPDEAAAFGLPDQVLAALLTDAFQVDAAHALGLDLGDDALAARVRSDPMFMDSRGTFNRQQFDYMLADNRFDEAEYLERERDEAAREMLVNGVVGGLSAPEPYVRAFNRFQNQRRVVEYVELTDATLPALEPPTDAELRTYFEENRDDFRAPEYRTMTTITLTAESIADPDAVTETEVQNAYNRDGAFGRPERRHVQQVVLPDSSATEQAAQQLNDGEEFSVILAQLERSFADVDLGFVTRDELVDPAVADAAFALEVGQAQAVAGRFGPVLVRVSEIEDSGKAPLEEVEDEIRIAVAAQKAARELRTVSDTIEDEFAGGASVAEVAERFGLVPLTTTVDQGGIDQDGNIVDMGPAASAVVTAFAMEQGEDPRRVRGANERVWVQLDSVIASRERDYEEVPDAVLAAYLSAREATRLGDKAEEALALIDGGQPVAEVAETIGGTPTTTPEFSRAEPAEGLPDGLAAAAFEGGLGHTGTVIVGPGRQVAFKVTEVLEPVYFDGAADLQPVVQTLNEGLANALLFGLVQAHQANVGADVNEPIFMALTGRGDDPRLHGMY